MLMRKNSEIVPVGNLQALFLSLSKLLDDPQLRQERAKLGRETALSF